MKEQLEERLQQLQQEYQSGQQMLAELQAKEADLQQTLLRISGAIQVLGELLHGDDELQINDSVPDGKAEELAA